MSNKFTKMAQKCIYIRILITCLIIICAFFCQAMVEGRSADLKKDSGLQIYLPREVMIKNQTLTLGQIGIVRGPADLVAKANEVKLGQMSTSGQEIVIKRHIVLSRLASEGIPASKVTLQGAEKVTVKQKHKIIIGDEFVKLAEAFLKQNLSDNSVSQWNPIRRPNDLVIPNPSKDIRFSPQLIQNGAGSQTKVEITVFSGIEKLGAREVTFALKYHNRTAVTLVDIPAGTLISSENVKIEKSPSNYPEPTNWKPPYGLVAKRVLPAETVVLSHMIGSAKLPVIIKRNQNVVIRIKKPGFLITAVGKAMQDGKAGECIKVRNIDSQRIITAKINQDRSVEPVF